MKQYYISDKCAFKSITWSGASSGLYSFSRSQLFLVFTFAKYLIKNQIFFCLRPLIMLTSFLLFSPMFSFAQINVLNDGLPIINKNIDVIINGNIIHKNNGSIANAGNFYISGDLINDNITSKVFTAGNNGWVHLDSATQTIGGITATHFNNLELSGTGVKQLNNVDAEVEDTLALNDREFASGDNTILVMATGTGVITRTSGFVSSTNDGGLSRNTLSTNTYFFPVGSSLSPPRFRPVDITPNSAVANTFKVRMANLDATIEGFDLSLKDGTVGATNSNFYHRINRINGNSLADVTLYYDNNTDGNYDIITQWANTAQWENLGTVATTSNYGFSGITKSAIYNFSTTPFALSSEVVASVFVPNIFSPNGDGFNDVLRVRGKGIAELEFIIYDRWGEKVFETTDANVGWDGTYKGEPMNLAVFVYVIKGKFKNGDVIDKKGNFTLLR